MILGRKLWDGEDSIIGCLAYLNGVGWCKLFGAFGNGVWAWRPLIEKKKKRVDVHLNKISLLNLVSFSVIENRVSLYMSQIPWKQEVTLIIIHS